jgi:hypothetical protein
MLLILVFLFGFKCLGEHVDNVKCSERQTLDNTTKLLLSIGEGLNTADGVHCLTELQGNSWSRNSGAI